MKPKTARRILKKRACEIARYHGFHWQARWLHRLEDKCHHIVAEDKMDKVFRRRTP